MPTKSLQSVLASSSPNLGYFFIDEPKQVLYTLKRLANRKTPGMLEEANWFVNFIPAGIIQPEEPTYSIFFKHVVQALFRQLDLHKIDGFHFSPSLATNITKDCESWPGFMGQFGIHQYEQRMLCVDLAPATFTRCYPKKMQQQHLCPVDEGSVTPKDRLAKILMLLVQLEGDSFKKVQERLDNSGLDIYQRLVECGGRVLPRPALIHNTKTAGELNINLEKWAIVSPTDYALAGVTVAKNLAEVAELDLGFKIAKPQHFCRLSGADTSFYVKAIEKLAEHNLEMLLVVVVPSPKLDIRVLVQKVAECGILAQFVEPQDFFNMAACPDSDYMQKKLKTLATQMSVKLGAEPWHVDLPFNDAMLIAIDYNADTGILGLISSTNENLTRYFSTNEKLTRYFSTTSTIQHRPTWTIIWTEIEKCLDVYRACNNEVLPNRIFFYRNGVASQELSEVRNDELIHVKESLFNYYNNCQCLPKFVYTVVTAGNSAHNCTRIFEYNYDHEQKFLPGNPPVGTVVDTDITFHGQQDFYLVGTESSAPVHYNMLFNSTGLRLWEMEGLTYKFCSLYYGDSGSKRLGAPAPVEYAHALVREYGNAAAGIGIQGQVHDGLCDKLHFL
jgi:aubergine-like protein